MKKLTLFTLLCLTAGLSSAVAQEKEKKTTTTVTTTTITTEEVPMKRAQNVFFELGGQGTVFSANYDSRFFNKRNGIGGRIGIGYVGIEDNKAVTVPLSLNYLLGKGSNLFEIGLGATYISTSSNDNTYVFDDNTSNVVGTMSFAYRLQPVDSGFALRAGFAPIFGRDFFLPYFVGFSIGYTF